MNLNLNSLGLRQSLLLCLLVGSLFLCVGCGGKAEVTIVNNTSRYANGDIDGNGFGIASGGSAKREVDVGGFFSSSSEVTINVDIHCSEEMYSGVAGHLRHKMKMKKDYSYAYDIYYSTFAGRYKLRLLNMESGSPILGP